MRHFLASVVILVAAAAGCSDGSSMSAPGMKYSSMQALANRLGCTDLEALDLSPDTTALIRIGPEMRSESGHCNFNGQRMKLDLFEDSKHLSQYQAMAKSVGCAFAKGFGISEIHQAVGSNWVVSPDDNLDEATASAVATELGGRPNTINC